MSATATATATAAPAATKAGDPRLGSIIRPGRDGDIVLIGFPHDEGTVRNGGRAGSRNGPSMFRHFVAKMGCVQNRELGVDLSNLRISDGGDVAPGAATIEEAHIELRAAVRSILERGALPFVVGGSNDQSSSNGMAFLDVFAAKNGNESGAIINIDAHLDVRPRLGDDASVIHSGCPFRDLLEDPRMAPSRFVEFAAQGSQCSGAHVDWLKAKGCPPPMWLSQVQQQQPGGAGIAFEKVLGELTAPATTNSGTNNTPAFVSFDIDAVSGADCPGVSCPSTVGLSAKEALDICFAAGRNTHTKLFDLSEMNPVVEGYRTPRLAANMFYYFCCGFVQRGGVAATDK